MQKIYPFAKSNKQIIAYYNLINDYIDHPYIELGKSVEMKGANERPRSIALHPKFSKMSFSNHRIWYHWGFNTNPRKYTPLVEIVNKNIAEGKLSPSDVDEFWNLINKDRGERNRKLMNETTKIFGYPDIRSISSIQREQVNAFVTILYSIHLLGDHQTSKVDVISDLEAIYRDIYNAIDNLGGKDKKNRTKAKEIKSKLRITENDPKLFLDKMEKEFSPFLLSLDGSLYNYKAKFEKMGYKLK